MDSDLIPMVILCHDLLTEPRDIDVRGMMALSMANPTTLNAPVDAMSIAATLRGYSKAECKRRGVSISEQYNTPRPSLKWASVKMGRNDYEPIYIECTSLS